VSAQRRAGEPVPCLHLLTAQPVRAAVAPLESPSPTPSVVLVLVRNRLFLETYRERVVRELLSHYNNDPLHKITFFGQVGFAGSHLLLPLMTATLDLGLPPVPPVQAIATLPYSTAPA
jgi:hypothetical protein